MLGIRNATSAVTQSADAITDLAKDFKVTTRRVESQLSSLTAEVRETAQIAPYLLAGTALLSVAAILLSLLALNAVTIHD